jgi:hypothetical protein
MGAERRQLPSRLIDVAYLDVEVELLRTGRSGQWDGTWSGASCTARLTSRP